MKIVFDKELGFYRREETNLNIEINPKASKALKDFIEHNLDLLKYKTILLSELVKYISFSLEWDEAILLIKEVLEENDFWLYVDWASNHGIYQTDHIVYFISHHKLAYRIDPPY